MTISSRIVALAFLSSVAACAAAPAELGDGSRSSTPQSSAALTAVGVDHIELTGTAFSLVAVDGSRIGGGELGADGDAVTVSLEWRGRATMTWDASRLALRCDDADLHARFSSPEGSWVQDQSSRGTLSDACRERASVADAVATWAGHKSPLADVARPDAATGVNPAMLPGPGRCTVHHQVGFTEQSACSFSAVGSYINVDDVSCGWVYCSCTFTVCGAQ